MYLVLKTLTPVDTSQLEYGMVAFKTLINRNPHVTFHTHYFYSRSYSSCRTSTSMHSGGLNYSLNSEVYLGPSNKFL
jgi:hypothetical protein